MAHLEITSNPAFSKNSAMERSEPFTEKSNGVSPKIFADKCAVFSTSFFTNLLAIPANAIDAPDT